MSSEQNQAGTYFDNVNHELLAMVNPSAKTIVECGCGAGGLARAVKHTNPSVRYIGIELVADQLAQAESVLDVALLRNLDQTEDWNADDDISREIPLASQDHFIFGDVLEHLQAPQRALQNAVSRLKPGGSILACIPNVAHWSVFAQLVLGTWPQLDAGLFDRTHLRWFTLADMVKMLEAEGLQVEQVMSRIYPHADAEEIMDYLEPLALHLGRDPAQLKEHGMALQFVLKARKPAALVSHD